MKEQLFNNKELQQNIDTLGYLIIKLSDLNCISQIRNLYNETIANKQKSDLYESSRNNDTDTNNYINQQLQDIINPIAQEYFKKISFYGGTFMVKTNKHTTELPLHQDWNIVDEQKDTVYLLWIPIQDVDENNGTIFLIEKSHILFENYRSGSFPSVRISRQYLPSEKVKTIQLKVGEILIYNPAIFHGSYKNNTTSDRVVATAMVTNNDASLLYYHKIDEKSIAAYQLTSQSYLNDITQIANGIVPKGAKLLDTLHNKTTSISKDMLLNELNIKYGFKEKIIKHIKATIFK